MAVNQTLSDQKLLKETVATNLTINRFLVEKDGLVEPSYNIQLTFADHTFLANQQGEPTKVIINGENPKTVYLTKEQGMAFFTTPVQKADGTPTVLGLLLADLMDDVIVAHLADPQV